MIYLNAIGILFYIFDIVQYSYILGHHIDLSTLIEYFAPENVFLHVCSHYRYVDITSKGAGILYLGILLVDVAMKLDRCLSFVLDFPKFALHFAVHIFLFFYKNS